MNLHLVDWAIVAFLLVSLIAITVASQRHMKDVADFLAAGRVARRYMLCIAAGLPGAISIVAGWEMIYSAGLPTGWWGLMATPVGLIMTLTGFVVYRFRQTRALTLAQFIEMRYSRRFRIFCGMMCFVSGIINYGIFPAVTARFIIYFFGFPQSVAVAGLNVSMFPLIMFLELSIGVYLAVAGGQITVMLTDFFQGMFTLVMYVVLMIFIWAVFSWSDIVEGLKLAPAGQSMLNPFQTSRVQDFNIWYFLIGVFGSVYGFRAWQGNAGYNSAALTPHEAKMAGILGGWRGHAQGLLMLLIPLVAYAIMHHPKFAVIAAPMQQQIQAITDIQLQKQMTVPIVLTHLLPAGLLGMFASVILAAAINTDASYLHSWGSIFIQDVVLPFRKRPLELRLHLSVLRLAIVGVAAFGFLFSLIFPLKDYILMFFNVTGAIYVGGAGAVILGGLYWKRGTTAAAWTAMITGCSLALGGIILQQVWKPWLAPQLLAWFPHSEYLQSHAGKFPLNGQLLNFIAMAAAMLSYAGVSLLGPHRVFDLDRMLHRGKYAADAAATAGQAKRRRSLVEILGITSEFTRKDRILFYATMVWSLGWWCVFIVGTIWNLVQPASDDGWATFWYVKLCIAFMLGMVMTVWFLIGGIHDTFKLFESLRTLKRDVHDDGTVNEPDAMHDDGL